MTCVALGAWAYVGGNASTYFTKWMRTGGLFLTPAVVIMLLPGGLGITLIGIALIVGKNAVTEQLVVGGLFFVIAGWVLYFFHPRWVRPRWMR